MTEWFDKDGAPINIEGDPVKRRAKAGDSLMVTHVFRCNRCGGSGVVRPWGTCFTCGGSKRSAPANIWVFTAAGLERKNAAKAKRAAAKEAKRKAAGDACMAKWREAEPDLLAAMDEMIAEYEADNTKVPFPDFAFSLRNWIGNGKDPTDKMISGFGRYVEGWRKKKARDAEYAAKKAADKAAEKPIPADLIGTRAVVTGEVLTIKEKPGWGYYDRASWKMLVRDDRGFKVWGTAPQALFDAEFESGDRVKFEALIAASDDDPAFGFFNRPTKAELLEANP
jgi:hypothetical protein